MVTHPKTAESRVVWPNCIRDLEAIAKKDGLAIKGIVADLTSYTPTGVFEVILIDRTLHMLARDARLSVLATLLNHLSENGWVPIADETSNIRDFQTVVSARGRNWTTEYQDQGYLFVRRS